MCSPWCRSPVPRVPVQGLASSLGGLIVSQRVPLPVLIRTTVMPFDGYWAYDGLMTLSESAQPLTKRVIQKIATAYANAAETGTLVYRSPPVIPVERLFEPGQEVGIHGLQNQAELNGRRAVVVEWVGAAGRYVVDVIDGPRIRVRPSNLMPVEAAAAPAAPAALPAATLALVDELRRAPRAAHPGRGGPCPTAFCMGRGPVDAWIVRRMDYTEALNPDHMFTIIDGRSMILHYGQTAHLVPTVEEVIEAIAQVCLYGSDPQLTPNGWRAGRVPCAISVDAIEILPALKAALAPAHLNIHYYAPPSEQEQQNRGQAAPMGLKRCAFCEISAQELGAPLNKCSRCLATYYCSEDHQRKHWKKHKPVCGLAERQ